MMTHTEEMVSRSSMIQAPARMKFKGYESFNRAIIAIMTTFVAKNVSWIATELKEKYSHVRHRDWDSDIKMIKIKSIASRKRTETESNAQQRKQKKHPTDNITIY
jgi:hypothetical protein